MRRDWVETGCSTLETRRTVREKQTTGSLGVEKGS